jgi:hypothetical protein
VAAFSARTASRLAIQGKTAAAGDHALRLQTEDLPHRPAEMCGVGIADPVSYFGQVALLGDMLQPHPRTLPAARLGCAGLARSRPLIENPHGPFAKGGDGGLRELQPGPAPQEVPERGLGLRTAPAKRPGSRWCQAT